MAGSSDAKVHIIPESPKPFVKKWSYSKLFSRERHRICKFAFLHLHFVTINPSPHAERTKKSGAARASLLLLPLRCYIKMPPLAAYWQVVTLFIPAFQYILLQFMTTICPGARVRVSFCPCKLKVSNGWRPCGVTLHALAWRLGFSSCGRFQVRSVIPFSL